MIHHSSTSCHLDIIYLLWTTSRIPQVIYFSYKLKDILKMAAIKKKQVHNAMRKAFKKHEHKFKREIRKRQKNGEGIGDIVRSVINAGRKVIPKIIAGFSRAKAAPGRIVGGIKNAMNAGKTIPVYSDPKTFGPGERVAALEKRIAAQNQFKKGTQIPIPPAPSGQAKKYRFEAGMMNYYKKPF
jgi:hypothetical protein